MTGRDWLSDVQEPPPEPPWGGCGHSALDHPVAGLDAAYCVRPCLAGCSCWEYRAVNDDGLASCEPVEVVGVPEEGTVQDASARGRPNTA